MRKPKLYSAEARACSLLARCLQAALYREATGAGFLPLAVEERTAHGCAEAISRLLGADTGDRRVLPRLIAELLTAGALAFAEGGVVLDPAARSAKSRARETIASIRSKAVQVPENTTLSKSLDAHKLDISPTFVGENRCDRNEAAKDELTAREHSDHKSISRRERSERVGEVMHDINLAKDELTAREHSDHKSISRRELDGTGVALNKERKKERNTLFVPSHAGASASAGEGASASEGAPWVLDPVQVSRRLADASQGAITLAVKGSDGPLRAVLAGLARERGATALGEELLHWADLASRGEDGWWRHGARCRERLLGAAREGGAHPADGLRRCVQEARASLLRRAASEAREGAARAAAASDRPRPVARSRDAVAAARRAREALAARRAESAE